VNVSGMRVVISGAAGGIGSAACEAFCAAGADVIGVDIDEERGLVLEQELVGAGRSFVFHRTDVADSSSVKELVAFAGDRWGRLDVLLNIAGRVLGQHVLETSAEDWDAVLAVSLRGTFLMTRELAPLMQGHGSIVNMASTAALVGYPNMVAYTAAKGGVVQLTKVTAMELAPGIRANVMCPATIDTAMPRAYADVNTPEGKARWDSYSTGHLLGRVGQPDEVASVALFLASDASSFLTGTVVPVDGGWMAQ